MVESIPDPLTDEDATTLITLLTKAGSYPYHRESIFRAMQLCEPKPAVELIVTRNCHREVLLTRYSGGVSAFKNLLHPPGGYVFYGESESTAVERIARRELQCGATLLATLGVHSWSPGEHPNGCPVSVYVLCGIDHIPPSIGSAFYSVRDLPTDMVTVHRIKIPQLPLERFADLHRLTPYDT